MFQLELKMNIIKKISLIALSLFSLMVFANDMSPAEREAFYKKYQEKKTYSYQGSVGQHLNQGYDSNGSIPSGSSDYEKDTRQPYKIQNNVLPEAYQKNSDDFWNKPRRIYVKRASTGEVAEIFYYRNGRLDPQQYWLASYMLRDVTSKKMVYVDPKLLDLIAAVQAWLVYYGIHSPIIIQSGYRTPEYNKTLKGAARESMHLYGKAIDFRVDGLSVAQLSKIVSFFQAGGVGIYKRGGFVHMDTGGIRVWHGK